MKARVETFGVIGGGNAGVDRVSDVGGRPFCRDGQASKDTAPRRGQTLDRVGGTAPLLGRERSIAELPDGVETHPCRP